MMKEVLAIDVSMHSKLCQRRLAMRKSFFCLTFQKDPIKRSQMAVRAFLCYNKTSYCLIYSAKGAVFFRKETLWISNGKKERSSIPHWKGR